MAGMLGMVIGRGAQGWSEGRLGEIKAEREARMKELEEQRADRRAQQDRDFRSKEAAIGDQRQAAENKLDRESRIGESKLDRESRLSESKADRESREREAAATRDANAETVTTDTGDTMVRSGSTVKPLVDEEGKKVRLAATSKDAPAEVSTAEWLIKQGVAKDADDAWRLVRSARNDPERSRSAIYKAWLEILKPGEYSGKTLDPAAIQEEAMKRADEAMRMMDAAEEPSGEPASPEGPAKAEPDKPGALLAPPGLGDKDDPFKATKQTHVEWFKKYAKPGQVIVIDGKPYTK